jgi:hypothetical protein
MPWPCLGRAAAQLVLTCRSKSAYPFSPKAEPCLYNSLLPSREKVAQRLRSFYKTAGMRGRCRIKLSWSNHTPHLPLRSLLSLKGRGSLYLPKLDPRLRGDDDKGRGMTKMGGGDDEMEVGMGKGVRRSAGSCIRRSACFCNGPARRRRRLRKASLNPDC